MSSTYQRSQALQNPDESAVVLHAILMEKYGQEWLDWDPVTIALEAQADFQTDPCSEAMDRACAVQVIMTSDAFFKRLDAFLGCVHTINTGAPAFDAFAPSSVEEISWAIAEVSLLRELLPFSYAIRAYVQRLLAQDGYDMSSLPAVLNEMFDHNPEAADVRQALRTPDQTDDNKNNIDMYINDKLSDLVSQFNEITDLSGLDEVILQRGADEALKSRGII